MPTCGSLPKACSRSALDDDFGRAVSRILSASLRTERIICLSSRYPKPVPPKRNPERAAPRFPIWPCTRWGFPCLRACAWSGKLLPHLFTLTTDRSQWRFKFLWHFPSKSISTFRPRVSPALRQELRGIAPCGVRTFLPRLAPEAILRPSKIVVNLPGQPNDDKFVRFGKSVEGRTSG